MKDKDLQKELWRKGESIKTLDEVLGVIRASETVIENQSAMAGQTSGFMEKKCFEYDQIGQQTKNCPQKPTNQPVQN